MLFKSEIMKQLFIFIALISLFLYHGQAKEYYISPSGEDSNKGTIESPFATIQKAAAVMKPTDSPF